jgi:TonB family protein
LLASLAACSAAAAQEPEQLAASAYVPAEPVQRRNPIYPSSAITNSKEGWVVLSYVISPSGDVIEPMIEDSSGVEAFERAALRAVEGWKYRPATQDGEPVEQAMTKARMQFQLEGKPRGASAAFVSKYRRIVSLVEAKDFAGAEALITELEFGERANLYEDAWFWWMKYLYLSSAGSADTAEMRRSLQRALGYEQEYLPPDQHVAAAERLFVLHARALDIAAALATFERLRDAKEARRSANYEPVIANLRPSYERLLEIVDGEDFLVLNGAVGEFDYWVHDLLRRSFSVADIAGRLDALDIRCERGTRRYHAVPVDTVWTIPPSWGKCGAYIKGEPGTTFAFREYPRSFAPAATVDVAVPAASEGEAP